MLGIYKKLFESLRVAGVAYCAYKSLNHLDEDLDGARGDLDLLVAGGDFNRFQEIAQEAGFACASHKEPYYYVALDPETHKFVMLDVCTKINFGPKPYKPYRLDLEFKNLSIKVGDVNKLSAADYYPLMFYMRTASKSEKLEDLQELQDGIASQHIAGGEVLAMVERRCGKSWKEISEDVIKARSWKDIKDKYRKAVVETADARKLCFGPIRSVFLFKLLRVIKSRLGIPPYKVRRMGHLVAFVGVDGAGKTSTIDYVKDLDYFKCTGVKRVYFGNNEYKLPGLNKMLSIEWKSFPVRLFFSTLGLIDRQLRVLIAQYYIMLGNVVLADRYYYDDEIGRLEQKEQGVKVSPLKRVYRMIFGAKMLKKPDVAVFLDVSPEVAYQRKQDYSYEIMLEQNKLYKEYMYAQPRVLVVNADQSQSLVYKEIVESILKLDDKNC